MKTNKFYLLLATFMVCATSVFISCSDDDDNNSSKEQGDKAVEALKIRVLDDEGNVVFGEKNEQGFYEIGMENQEDATTLVGGYVNNANYDGGATTYILPDGRGDVSVEPSPKKGVYYNLGVRVKSIPEMKDLKLQVVEPGYMEGENRIFSVAWYKCNDSNCGKEFKLPNMAAKQCPVCGNKDVTKIEK